MDAPWQPLVGAGRWGLGSEGSGPWLPSWQVGSAQTPAVNIEVACWGAEEGFTTPRNGTLLGYCRGPSPEVDRNQGFGKCVDMVASETEASQTQTLGAEGASVAFLPD